MCFTANIKNKGHIATRDIRVEKVFLKTHDEDCYRSPFYANCKWKIGEEKQSFLQKTKDPIINVLMIEDGLHSAKHIIKDSTQCWDRYSTKCLIITHLPPKEGVICECIIPKGAEYYYNRNGEYVSNRLILVKPIEKCSL